MFTNQQDTTISLPKCPRDGFPFRLHTYRNRPRTIPFSYVVRENRLGQDTQRITHN